MAHMQTAVMAKLKLAENVLIWVKSFISCPEVPKDNIKANMLIPKIPPICETSVFMADIVPAFAIFALFIINARLAGTKSAIPIPNNRKEPIM